MTLCVIRSTRGSTCANINQGSCWMLTISTPAKLDVRRWRTNGWHSDIAANRKGPQLPRVKAKLFYETKPDWISGDSKFQTSKHNLLHLVLLLAKNLRQCLFYFPRSGSCFQSDSLFAPSKHGLDGISVKLSLDFQKRNVYHLKKIYPCL